MWIRALETIVEHHQIPSAFFNNPNDQGIFTERQIFLYKKGNKILTIHIYLSTGIILFKGAEYSSWIEKYMEELIRIVNNFSPLNPPFNEKINSPQASKSANISEASPQFSKLDTISSSPEKDNAESINITTQTPVETEPKSSDIIEPVTPSQPSPIIISELSMNDKRETAVDIDNSPDYIPSSQPVTGIHVLSNNLEEKSISPSNQPVCSNNYKTSSPKNSENLSIISEQLQTLWSANKKTNTGMEVLSNGIKNTSKTISQVQDSMQSHTERLENLINRLSCDFDTKLETFMLSIESTINKKLTSFERKFESKIQSELTDIKKRLSEREGDLKKIEDCFSSYTVCLDTKVDDAICRINKIDTSAFNSLQEVTNEICVTNNNLSEEVNKIKSQIQDQVS